MPDPFAEHVTGDPPPSLAESLEGLDLPTGPDPEAPARPRPTVGRIVHYVLTESDISRITWGVGNAVPGQVVPAIVVSDVGNGALNLHAFPEAQTSVWVQAQGEGTEPGQWSWPPRDGDA